MPVPIKANDILVDDDGKPIQINDRITRKEYANIGSSQKSKEASSGEDVDEQENESLCIPEFIETTIRRSRVAIEKAGLTDDQLDIVVLVGGSTHGQWIQEAMKEAFSCEVTVHYSPESCVAAGAALQAAGLPPAATGTGEKIEIVVPCPIQPPSIG